MAKKKELSERGKKTRAGMLLSNFLRQIAQEKTEVALDANGEDRMVTKAEAIARLMYKMALGYEETGDEGKVIKHRPDKSMIALIFDRIEGRAPMMNSDEARKKGIADRVGEEGANRINRSAGIED